MRAWIATLAGFLTLMLATSVAAQEEASDTSASHPTVAPDRPGFSDGSGTIVPGHVQLEAGARAGFGSIANNYTPLNLLGRIGLGEVAELRIGVVPVAMRQLTVESISSNANIDKTQTTSLPELSLGAKFSTDASDSIEVAVLPSFALLGVTDNAGLTGSVKGIVGIGGLGPVSLGIDVGLSDIVTIGRDVGVTNQLEITGAVVASVSVSETVGVFLEPYTRIPTAGGPASIRTDGGVTWQVTNELQLDAWGDVEFNQDNSVASGLGASYLF